MNKISLRLGITRTWNHLYYQNLSSLDPRLIHGTIQLPSVKRDQYLIRIISGLIKFKKIEIHKTRDVLDIYICKDRYISTPIFSTAFNNSLTKTKNLISESINSRKFSHGFSSINLSLYRALLNIFKTRIQIFNLYTFPIHDSELIIKYLLRDYKNKSRFNNFKRLLKLGIIKGIHKMKFINLDKYQILQLQI
jgi:hypothetical protein